MKVLAGVDVGNATTEVVLGRVRAEGIEVLATGRAPTRRAKGSRESLDGAAALVRRLERQYDVHVDATVAAPLRPVQTTTATLPEEHARTGRLWLVAADAGTAGGRGTGVGRPVRLDVADGGTDPVVVVVPAGTGFAAASSRLAPLAESGRLAAVLVEDDEGVLIANRLASAVPVVDEIDAAAVLAADLIAVEVAADGHPLQMLTDVLRLGGYFDLSVEEYDDAARLVPMLHDSSNAVVASGGSAPSPSSGTGGWIHVAGQGRLDFLTGHSALTTAAVGAARAYALPPVEVASEVEDMWTVDLAAVASAVQARRGSFRSRPVSLAALRRDAPLLDPSPGLSDRLQRPAHVVSSEASAARAGGLSTPGAVEDTVVVDLGGGTIDAVSATVAVVAAGGGDLLTASVAELTGVTGAVAEWVKRGPASRVEAPQVLLAEDGSRGFLDRPAPSETVGSLVVRGPTGLLPFSTTMAPGEWRALRRRLKVDLVGGNVARVLRTLDEAPRTVVVVGGPAGDDEVLAAVGGALGSGTAVGRGNVAGALGYRNAVAYGLLVLAADGTDAR